MLTSELVARVMGPTEWLKNHVSYLHVAYYFHYTNLQSLKKKFRKLML